MDINILITFPSVNFCERFLQKLYLSNYLFSKNYIEQFCLMFKNIKFSDTDNTIGITQHFVFCIKLFLEAIPQRLQSLKTIHRRKVEKLQKKDVV